MWTIRFLKFINLKSSQSSPVWKVKVVKWQCLVPTRPNLHKRPAWGPQRARQGRTGVQVCSAETRKWKVEAETGKKPQRRSRKAKLVSSILRNSCRIFQNLSLEGSGATWWNDSRSGQEKNSRWCKGKGVLRIKPPRRYHSKTWWNKHGQPPVSPEALSAIPQPNRLWKP